VGSARGCEEEREPVETDRVGLLAPVVSIAPAAPAVREVDDLFPGDERETRVLALLAAGRLGEVRRLIAAGGLPAPFATVARADIGVRTYTANAPGVQRLADDLANAKGHDPALVWWARALVAERLAMELDPIAGPVAREALAEIPGDDLLPVTALAARGRLRRVAASHAMHLSSAGAVEAGRRDREGAVADFLRCGHGDEVLLTDVLESAVGIVFFGEPHGPLLGRMIGHRSLLDDPASLWPPLVDHMIWVLAALFGDAEAGEDARARLSTRPEAAVDLGPWPALVELAGHLDGTRLAAFDAALARFDRRFIRFVWGMMLVAANRLADAGHPDALRRAQFALGAAGLGPEIGADLALHRHRFEIAAGRLPPVEEMVGDLRRLRAAGRPESAARFARVLAGELGSRSATDEAIAVRDWETREPRSVQEPTEPVAAPRLPGVHVTVLAPVLEVSAHGEAVRLGHGAALLVVHLVVADGRLHVEQVGNLLWPEAPLPVVRQRLNSLLHRLRRQHPAVGTLLSRTGDVVLLDSRHCVIDLTRFDTPSPGAETVIEALGAVRGNLCQVQFPYDEHLVEARHQVVARWTRQAREVLTLDPGARPRLMAAAAALDVDPEMVGPPPHRPTTIPEGSPGALAGTDRCAKQPG
jgi:hypothetical protein